MMKLNSNSRGNPLNRARREGDCHEYGHHLMISDVHVLAANNNQKSADRSHDMSHVFITMHIYNNVMSFSMSLVHQPFIIDAPQSLSTTIYLHCVVYYICTVSSSTVEFLYNI